MNDTPSWSSLLFAENTKIYKTFIKHAQRFATTGDKPIWLIDDTTLRLLIALMIDNPTLWLQEAKDV